MYYSHFEKCFPPICLFSYDIHDPFILSLLGNFVLEVGCFIIHIIYYIILNLYIQML